VIQRYWRGVSAGQGRYRATGLRQRKRASKFELYFDI